MQRPPEMIWAQPTCEGELPNRRSGHSFTVLGSQGFLFGGCDHSQPPGPTNDLYVLDMSTANFYWTKAATGQGEAPPARWRHAAVALDNDSTILVMGGFRTSSSRFNDVWLLDTKTLSWSQPPPGETETNAAGVYGFKSLWANVPSPRGAHTVNLVDGKAYVLFGYGGTSTYARKEFDTVHTLRVDNWSWKLEITEGETPEPRSGHQSVVVRETILVCGGWNSVRQFDDVHVFDTETNRWSAAATGEASGWGPPRWNHTAVAVPAVPSWKVFVFGGNSGDLSEGGNFQGTYLNDVLVLDAGSMTWSAPDTMGDAPAPRAETEMAWDKTASRMVMFGGWAGRWFGDVHTLKVGEVVGPPYSLEGLGPLIGPITGKTKLHINGIGFVTGGAGGNVTVRFACPKGFLDVGGEVLSDTELVVETPDYQQFGPLSAEVRVSLGSHGLTNTALQFTFFAVTNASKCIAFGPGLMAGGAVSYPTTFIIQARDSNNHARDCGMDEWAVKVTPAEKAAALKAAYDGAYQMVVRAGEEAGEDAEATAVQAARAGEAAVAQLEADEAAAREEDDEAEDDSAISDITVTDLDDGSYQCHFTCHNEGSYVVDVAFMGTFEGEAGPVRGSPFTFSCESNVDKSANTMDGPVVMGGLRDSIRELKEFSTGTLRGLRKKLPKDDVGPLIKVREHLHSIDERKDEVLLDIDQTRQTLQYLKKEGGHVDRQIDDMEKAAGLWADVEKQVPQTQTAIVPLVKVQGAKTEQKILEYHSSIEARLKEFKTEEFWLFATGSEEAREQMTAAEGSLAEERKVCEANTHLCNMFDFPQLMNPTNAIMASMANDLNSMRTLWDVAEELLTFSSDSRQVLWSEVNAEELEDGAKSMMKSVKSLDKNIRWSDAYRGLDKYCKDFLNTVPLISMLGHNSMRPRHWQMLMTATGKQFVPPHEDPDLKLEGLLALDLHEFSADVEEICDQAVKEAKMEQQLQRLEETWTMVEFLMEPYKDTDVPLLKVGEEDFEMLENDQLLVQGMMASRYVGQFEAEVSAWQQALGMVSDIVTMLADIQRTWSYLEPLFIHSDEVKRELPEDATRFEGIDRDVKAVLSRGWELKNVKEVCNEGGLLERLEGIDGQLSLCKKSLADFLDGRRRQFPRFYFTSEADLLDILSNGSSPEKVMVHVPKVYLATKTLELDTTNRTSTGRPLATAFIAGVGQEVVHFHKPVPLEGKVEVYLQTVLDAMKSTLFDNLLHCRDRYVGMKRSEWLMHRKPDETPTDVAQINLLVLGVNYVAEVEEAFAKIGAGDKGALREYNQFQISQLSDLITLTQTSLSKSERQRVMCAITLDAHGRDIVEKMVREGVEEATAFQWQSQLKPMFRVSPPQASFLNRDPHLRGPGGERAEIAICDAIMPYDYEYLGNGPRLVITPLTDRIYVTATQALNLKMGCAPAGPAGTGKTESTKDLASALGKVCYVFNCSPEMDYQSLGNIFKGLASSGSWGCFDEFNRLVPEVLSVCSVQFKAVCDSVRAEVPRFVLEGDEISLDPTCGAFITMNPGYLGRSELPEGLKALFRPMTVMVPDLVLICENMLMAEGFVKAKQLASKFYGLYSLLRELLSKQLHYDWGLRAVKSVLVVAGGFKRAEPNTDEEALLMRALRDFNTPKIVREDEVIFFGLLTDLFPGIDPPRKVDEDLEQFVTSACEELGNWPDETFRLKVVQLEELLAIRHCVFVMGPPASGKSQCWRTLAKARTMRGDNTKVVDINPKSVATEELYGYITMATREWKDGLLSKIMRDLGLIPNEKPKWIILDGDLDANWIESMNSVMDDNRMLTLASNERIPLKPHMRMLFEIRDLAYATPATVSRAGILYISTDDGTQWKSLIASWVNRREEPAATKAILTELFETYVEPVLLWVKINTTPVLPIEDVSAVSTLIYMLDGMLSPDVVSSPQKIEIAFVFCAVWAFGSFLTVSDDGTDYKKMFSDWWRAEWKKVKFPSRENVFDYWLDPASCKFEPWGKSPYFYTVDYESTTPMAQVTVPTPETCSITFWMEVLLASRRAVMLAGPAGTGKTQMVMGLLGKQDPLQCIAETINFNFYTNSVVLQTNMEIPLEKKTGTNFGPPGQARLVYFVDDINLPEVDLYNTQSAISLLRQHMEYEHVYDRSKLAVKNISNTQVVACMNPTAGSFHVNPRLQRHFACFAVGLPGPTSLLTIYQTFLDGHLKTFSPDIKALSSNMIKAALGLHSQVAAGFKKTAANFHYEFNIRHLSNVFQGLLVAQPEQFPGPEKFVILWLHESERVYGDRLVSETDLAKYQLMAQAQAKKLFPNFNMSKYFAAENAEPLVFCHFADNIQDKLYDQVTSIEKMSVTLDDALREYNETNATMDLVLFDDAMKHVARIVRIILNVGGHALLVGVGGSGKQSLSRLAAFICSYTVYQIVISSTYSIADFKEDLKTMYSKSGLRDEGIMFLMTDSQITNERFLIYLNDLLASGNIPDLYTGEDKDAVINDIASKVKAAGLPQDRATCWDFFIKEVRRNLHVVLCFSPVGDDFRNRARKFPAIVNCTVIDWFQPWPRDALHSVGKKFLAEIADLGSDEMRTGIENFMPFSFETVNKAAKQFLETERRYVYTTPKSYLELLKLYNQLLAQKRAESEASIARLSNGLQKLKQTGESVAQLEEELKVALVAAEEKKVVSEGIAEQVAREKAVVEVETQKATEEAEVVTQIQKEVTIKQRSTEEDLAKAEPAVEAAMGALNTLNRKDLSECKTMAKPPAGVDDVFSATMVLLANVHPNVVVQKNGKVRDRSWDAAKKQLLGSIPEYLDALRDYKESVDSGIVPTINWREVRPYLELPHFDTDVIATKNSAAAGLCSWVINIVMYYDIVTTVEPKRQALREANEQLDEANTRLKLVTDMVAELQEKLDKLTVELDAANRDKQEAMDTVDRGMKKLDLAQRLTTALASENVRWAENVVTLNEARELLVGDVLLAASFISYIGPFSKQLRDELIMNKFVPFLRTANAGEAIPMSESSNPLTILTDDAEVASWNTQGLPADRVSTENGAIVTSSARWPLMIDPQLQGITWVREKESDPERNLQIVRLGQKDLLRKLTACLENGHSMLIENMGEKIDAVLSPVIQRSTMKKGHKLYIKVGDAEVEFHPNFRLFLHTKLGNPHFPPEVQAECTLVNFTVTEVGLEDQLLALVVRKERPDLAQQSEDLVVQQNGFKIKIKELEDNILFKLATAEGDITEDVELIESLEETKRISNDIAKKVEQAHLTHASIVITSEKYRPVAARGSLLFFLMSNLNKMHTYYIYSLNAFTTVFLRGIDLVTEKPAEALETKAQKNAAAAADDDDALGGDDGDDEEKKGGDGGGGGGDADGADGEEKTGDGAGDGDGDAGEDKELEDEEELEADEEEEDEDEEGADGAASNAPRQLTDEELVERCDVLNKSITMTVFNYIRRGLFERDKLIVSCQLCLKVMLRAEQLSPEDVEYLINSKMASDAGNMGPLAEWLPEALWPKVKALEALKAFNNLGDAMQSESDDWQQWFDSEQPEIRKCPGDFQVITGFPKLILLRALRPDRIPAGLSQYVADVLGKEYVYQPPFDMGACYAETSPMTPVFFVLFPGVDPTPWVEGLGKSMGISRENNNFMNISMGQGQEAPAEAIVERFSKEGGWVMLQNCHLMQAWVPKLERLLEVVSEGAHDNFRCFISAEPPPIASWTNMPESLMQSCIKVANEAPADIQSNLTRAMANFDQDRIDGCTKPVAFKACLFSLCWFHAIVLGRRRFGQQGWSRAYSFNTGDLTICANVLTAYLDGNPDIPWDDLRYIFGEIMYGGHITDPWDRRTNNNYLSTLLNEGLFNNMELGPGFRSPNPEEMDFAGYMSYIDEKMVPEVPPLFGLHPNAEIGYLTNTSDTLFATILVMGGGSGGGSGGGGGSGSVVKEVMDDLLERMPEKFEMIGLKLRAKEKFESPDAPFIVVAVQECQRMNVLLDEMVRSLVELGKGLRGQLNMSQSMEDLSVALGLNQVPGRNPFSLCSWEKYAWWSKKVLVTWFADLIRRVEQLNEWISELETPKSLWLPGLFNPTAYLTAVMQVTARKRSLPLDKMTLETHVTTMILPEECTYYPEDGAFVHGLFIEGARWPMGDEAGDPVNVANTPCAGYLVESRLKELLPALPVIYVKAVQVDARWEPSAVGYLRHDPNIYEAPVYITTFRGPTYVFLATLPVVDGTSKWISAGVACILQED